MTAHDVFDCYSGPIVQTVQDSRVVHVVMVDCHWDGVTKNASGR